MSPRSVRDNLKRKTAQAVNHLAASVLLMADLQKTFAPAHPDYAEGLEVLAIQTAQVRQALLNFAVQAWETDEEGLATYL